MQAAGSGGNVQVLEGHGAAADDNRQYWPMKGESN